MVTRGLLCALAGALLLAAPAPAQQDGAEDEIRSCFAGYRAAVLANDGKTAASLVARSGIEYFGEMQRLALYATPEKVRAESPVNQIQILTLRHRIDADTLRAMSPSELFAHGVTEGWTAKDSVQGLGLGEIEVEGDLAAAQVTRDGSPTPLKYRFVREKGVWLWDMMPTVELSNQAFKTIAAQQKVSEEDLILSLLESVSGRAVPPTIWEPRFER